MSLSAALGLDNRELVALVGGGGKSAALGLLVEEAVKSGRRALATTTTNMYRAELCAAGPPVVQPSLKGLMTELRRQLSTGGLAAAARSAGPDDKVVGLHPEWVDEIWASGLVEMLIVEADGSRGAPLKAFGPHEPQVPQATTTVVQVAGLDAIGAPLVEPHVHRAQLLADLVGSPVGSTVTPDLFIQAVRTQHSPLSRRWPDARHVILLNKAEAPEVLAAGLQLAERLFTSFSSDGLQAGPDSVVVGSVALRSFHRPADGIDE